MFGSMTGLGEADAPTILDSGSFRIHEAFSSAHLEHARDVTVYLPPGYGADPERRYPVLYMHDGQNLFHPETAFAGQVWAVDRTISALLAEDAVEPLVVVGVYNTGAHRIDEYTPSRDPRMRLGGKADRYGRMLVEELKPFVDAHYRTRPAREATGLAGSSLGGLVTLHLGLRHPEVFGRLAALSPAVWWDNNFIVREVASLGSKPPTRIWLDTGTREGRGQVQRTRALRDALVARGWELGRDLAYGEARNARHTERAWSRRVGPFLRFLFPAERQQLVAGSAEETEA